MPKSIMEVTPGSNPNRQSYWIDFDVKIDGDHILTQLGFVVLLSAKFDGAITTEGRRFQHGDGFWYGTVRLKFDSYEAREDAMAHCRGHLDPQGRVNKNYVGALDYADRGARLASSLLNRVKGGD